MKVCDIPPFEWMTDCGGGTGLVTASGEVRQSAVDPMMPEPGAGLLFGSALVAMVLLRKIRL